MQITLTDAQVQDLEDKMGALLGTFATLGIPIPGATGGGPGGEVDVPAGLLTVVVTDPVGLLAFATSIQGAPGTPLPPSPVPGNSPPVFARRTR